MKLLFPVTTLLFWASICISNFGQDPKTVKKLKTQIVKTFEPKNLNTLELLVTETRRFDKETRLLEVSKFDNKKNQAVTKTVFNGYQNKWPLEYTIYDSDHKVIFTLKAVYKLNGDNEPLESVAILTDANGIQVLKRVWKYDEKKRLSEDARYRQLDKSKDTWQFIQKEIRRYIGDQKEPSVVDSYYADEGILVSQTIHQYDKDGRLAESVIENRLSGAREKRTFRYNDKGQVSECLLYQGAPEEVVAKNVFLHNDQGLLLQVDFYRFTRDVDQIRVYWGQQISFEYEFYD